MRLVSLALLIAGASLAHAAADPPAARIAEPAVPAELAARGTVYHTISGRQAQVTFTSDASIQNIVGKSNAVVGYAVSGGSDAPARLAGARWLLPVTSLATGIPLRDEHLAGEHWLDAVRFPTIEFSLDRVEDIAVAKSGADFTTFTATLIGRLTLHGVERELRVEKATLSFLKGSERTATIAPGDLLFVQCSYSVRLSDFGVRNGDVPDKVADSIHLTQMLRLTTSAPVPGGGAATLPSGASASREGD